MRHLYTRKLSLYFKPKALCLCFIHFSESQSSPSVDQCIIPVGISNIACDECGGHFTTKVPLMDHKRGEHGRWQTRFILRQIIIEHSIFHERFFKQVLPCDISNFKSILTQSTYPTHWMHNNRHWFLNLKGIKNSSSATDTHFTHL